MSIKIVCISDTHSRHDDIIIPKCDILVHAGDMTSLGTFEEITKFAKWLNNQPATHIICTVGNHEIGFAKHYPESLKWITDNCPRANVLINASVEVMGIKFYGSPYSPSFGHGWSYNAGRTVVEAAHLHQPFIGDIWSQIPDDTNFLITHTMPMGILDEVLDFRTGRIQNVGCRELLNRCRELKELKWHVGGHLHLKGGKVLVDGNITYVNAAICDDAYNPSRAPVVIEV
jgi:Icc-related predicted phosphoesterase